MTAETTIYTVTTTSVEQTERLGERMGARLQPGDVLCLSGPLGAGKTALTRGLARGWGAKERATSPTFTLINEYRRDDSAPRFYHMDAYRLEGAADAATTGVEDMLDSDGVLVIEWPERIQRILPPDCIWIALAPISENSRTLTLGASGAAADRLRAFGEVFD